MNESGKERFILTKSYEIAYALFRVAGTLEEKDFAERLRTAGAGLLQAGALQDHHTGRRSLQVIEALVKFAGDVSLMTPTNADLMLREIYILDAAIVERSQIEKAGVPDLSEVFSPIPAESSPFASVFSEEGHDASRKSNAAKNINVANFENAANGEDHEAFTSSREEREEPKEDAAVHAAHSDSPSFLKADMRQSVILDRIRQSGNCRIRDLQEVLPDCSERTIRYDLQSLMERDLIERVGAGGPAVSYRIRQMAG
jgi:hypothetical protein